MAASECQWFGIAIETASTFGSSKTRRRSWTYFGSEPYRAETCFMAGPMTFRSTSQTVMTRASLSLG